MTLDKPFIIFYISLIGSIISLGLTIMASAGLIHIPVIIPLTTTCISIITIFILFRYL